MRLVFITTSFPPSATPLSLPNASLLSLLSSKNYHIGVLIPDYPEREVRAYQSVSPHLKLLFLPSLPIPKSQNQRLFSSFPTQIINSLAAFKPHLVHYQHPDIHQFFGVYFWCKMTRTPLVISHHREFASGFLTNLTLSLFNQCSAIIVSSSSQKEFLIRKKITRPITIVPDLTQKMSSKALNQIIVSYDRLYQSLISPQG